METLNVVIVEILFCLVLAWVLGFLAAWILFRKVQKEYEAEIEELEENLSYASASNKNQERELIDQSLKIQNLEKNFSKNTINIEKKDNKQEDKIINEVSINKEKKKKENNDAEMLRLIEANLYSPKKKRK